MAIFEKIMAVMAMIFNVIGHILFQRVGNTASQREKALHKFWFFFRQIDGNLYKYVDNLMDKMAIFRSSKWTNWLHVESEWQKNPEIFTLWTIEKGNNMFRKFREIISAKIVQCKNLTTFSLKQILREIKQLILTSFLPG